MEYVEGDCLFDVAIKLGPLGEECGKALYNQLVNILQYLESMQIAHIDLKLENIVVDEQMNLKLIDFGFAQDQNINFLNLHRGTQSYMAPEIKERLVYNGTKADMFSSGVVLFILVVGNFPFTEARRSDKYYRLLLAGCVTQYWKEVSKTQTLSV